MKRIRKALRWNERSELTKTVFIILIVTGSILGSFTTLAIAMGTPHLIGIANGTSMIPTLQTGDLVILQARVPEDIEVGDIVVFVNDAGQVIMHRIIEIQYEGDAYRYYTQGDNNAFRDWGYCTFENIIGVVVLIVPFLEYISIIIFTALVVVLFHYRVRLLTIREKLIR